MKSNSLFGWLIIGVLLMVFSKAYTQNMRAIEILNNLQVYQSLLNECHRHELLHLREKEPYIELKKTLSCEYNFVILEIKTVNNPVGIGKTSGTSESLYCKIVFEIKSNTALLKEFYVDDKSRAGGLEKVIANHKAIDNYNWGVKDNDKIYMNEKISHYLTIANTIAMRAENCTSGDTYHPGCFTRISVNDDCIILSQINYMNARSINHKNDFSLRKLEFTIPFDPQKKDIPLFGYMIGEMRVEFSDGSSENNKSCGNAIQEQILIEMSREKVK